MKKAEFIFYRKEMRKFCSLSHQFPGSIHVTIGDEKQKLPVCSIGNILAIRAKK